MYITWGISRIFGREAKRRQTSVWRGRWGPIAWGTVRRILGVRVKDNFSRKKLPPCIVIANHTTHLDIILICAVLRIRGLLDTRWALKNSMLQHFQLEEDGEKLLMGNFLCPHRQHWSYWPPHLFPFARLPVRMPVSWLPLPVPLCWRNWRNFGNR